MRRCVALLIGDVDVELFPVCRGGAGAVEFGDDLYQMLAAEQKVSFGS